MSALSTYSRLDRCRAGSGSAVRLWRRAKREASFVRLPLALALVLEIGIVHATDSNAGLEPVLTFR